MDSLTREPIDLATRSRSRRWLMALLCLLVVAGIGYAIWFWPAGSGGQAARNRNANQPIPVLVATAEQKDVPIYLDALGTVQAFNTVTVKPMVDGPLLSVNFKEGQDVRQGDVLAQIDPRTYQAALDQAVAKKAQDEAQLANARLDLARYTKLAANNYTLGAAGRHGARAGRAGRGAGQAGPGADRQRAHPARLHHDRLAARRTDRHPPGGCRQHRARLGYHRPGGAHAAAADLGAVHLAAAGACAGEPGDEPGRGEGAGVCPGNRGQCVRRAGHRDADGARQPGRSHHRHDQAEGDVPQSGPSAVARRLRRRAAAGGHARRTRSWCRRPRCSAGRAAPTSTW